MKTNSRTLLQKANQAFKEKNYTIAYNLYVQAADQNKKLEDLVRTNLNLINKKLKKIDAYDPLKRETSTSQKFENPPPKKYIKKITNSDYHEKFTSFDKNYYLNNYPDISKANIDPWDHFKTQGWKEGRKPNSWFDTNYYITTYPDIKNAGVNPFIHYQKTGIFEGRKTNSFISLDQIKKIIDDGLFDSAYYLNEYEDVRTASIDPLYHYITAGYIEHRNPSLKFDTYFYIKEHGVSQCPLIHYINSNKKSKTLPDDSLIINSNNSTKTINKKIAVQVHLFYPDVAYQLLNYLDNIPVKFDLLISVVTHADLAFSKNFFKQLKNVNSIKAKVIENEGRDISPLLITFKSAWHDYDYLCHVHTKRSLHVNFGDEWRTYLFDKLLGSKNVINNALEKLESDSDLAFLYPENFYKIKRFTSNEANVPEINKLLNRLNLPEEQSFSHYPFSAGTMGWFKTKLYKELIDINFNYEDLKKTNTNLDATLAHALERFFAIYPKKNGYKTASYYTSTNNKNLISEANQFSQKYIVGDKWMRDDPKISVNSSASLSPTHNFFNKSSLVIHWVIPDYGIGAGGHMTIFRMVYFLEKLGHRQTIWIQNARNYRSPALAKETIAQHYQPIGQNVDVHFLPDETEWISGDVAIATDCWTAYPVRSMSKFKKRFYFIQDYEPMFHPMGENYLIAEQTYDFGFTAITAGTWLKKKAEDNGMTAYDFRSVPMKLFIASQAKKDMR